jgi:hypothetical protein
MHNRSSHEIKATSTIASPTGGNCVRLAWINTQPTTSEKSRNKKVAHLKFKFANRFGHPKENITKPVPKSAPIPTTEPIISQAGIDGSPCGNAAASNENGSERIVKPKPRTHQPIAYFF